MSSEIAALVDRIVKISTPSSGDVQRALGVTLQRTETTGDMDYFAGAFGAGPFDSVDLRINHASKLGILVLRARATEPTPRSKVPLDGYGQASPIVNPHVPPEGTTSYVFHVKGVELTFQFTTKTEILRLVSFKWPERKGG